MFQKCLLLLLILLLLLLNITSRGSDLFYFSHSIYWTHSKNSGSISSLSFVFLKKNCHQDQKNVTTACFMEQRFSYFPRKAANIGTTRSKQVEFRALSCGPRLARVQRKIPWKHAVGMKSQGPVIRCFQAHITDTLQSNVMFSVLDRPVLIKG